MKETDLAKSLIKSFDGTGYEIYQEVEIHGLGIADIVLKSDTFAWAVEVKTSMSLQVIAQAWYNLRVYDFSSICIPKNKQSRSKGYDMAHKICADYGLGIFRVDSMGNVKELLKAKFNRAPQRKELRLVDHQKNYAKAGNSNGDRWTPFNQTVLELKRYIKKNPGCKLKDALTHIKHHYASLSSAQNSIRQWVNSGVIQGIEINRGALKLID